LKYTTYREYHSVLLIINASKMDLQVNELTQSFSFLDMNEDKINKIIKIQKWFRGCMLRLKQLPLMMYKIKNYLKSQTIQFSEENEDGRINSCFDEDKIIKLLIEKFGDKIKKPRCRMWYDILAYDYVYH